jgi:hypothetical protein
VGRPEKSRVGRFCPYAWLEGVKREDNSSGSTAAPVYTRKWHFNRLIRDIKSLFGKRDYH